MNTAITMDGLTTPTDEPRFAPPKRARRVVVVSDDEDAQLMLAYARGEMRSFETLYSRHRAALYRYLVRQARDTEIANDLFQEVWSRVIVNRARYEPRAKFRTFLFTLAHNCFIDHCRRAKSRPQAPATSCTKTPVPLPYFEPKRELLAMVVFNTPSEDPNSP